MSKCDCGADKANTTHARWCSVLAPPAKKTRPSAEWYVEHVSDDLPLRIFRSELPDDLADEIRSGDIIITDDTNEFFRVIRIDEDDGGFLLERT